MMHTFIITAGGIGKRMGGSIPKQFLLLHGKPILIYTLERFFEADSSAQILLTLPSDWIDYWNEMIQKYNCNIPHTIISGGVERYDSIKNALQYSKGDIIGVHDGVRPCVSVQTILNSIISAQEKGSGVPFLPIKETIRKVNGIRSEIANRLDYILVQTPQCFKSEILKKAYELPYRVQITDDASLVEDAGYEIYLVEGNEENIKITTPLDLKLLESIG